jgi:hypothetical protein
MLRRSNGSRFGIIANPSSGHSTSSAMYTAVSANSWNCSIDLGYAIMLEGDRYTVRPPEGRELVFVGDLVDRGPGTSQVLRLVSS